MSAVPLYGIICVVPWPLETEPYQPVELRRLFELGIGVEPGAGFFRRIEHADRALGLADIGEAQRHVELLLRADDDRRGAGQVQAVVGGDAGAEQQHVLVVVFSDRVAAVEQLTIAEGILDQDVVQQRLDVLQGDEALRAGADEAVGFGDGPSDRHALAVYGKRASVSSRAMYALYRQTAVVERLVRHGAC